MDIVHDGGSGDPDVALGVEGCRTVLAGEGVVVGHAGDPGEGGEHGGEVAVVLGGVVLAYGIVDHGGELFEGYAEPVEGYCGSHGIDGGRRV